MKLDELKLFIYGTELYSFELNNMGMFNLVEANEDSVKSLEIFNSILYFLIVQKQTSLFPSIPNYEFFIAMSDADIKYELVLKSNTKELFSVKQDCYEECDLEKNCDVLNHLENVILFSYDPYLDTSDVTSYDDIVSVHRLNYQKLGHTYLEDLILYLNYLGFGIKSIEMQVDRLILKDDVNSINFDYSKNIELLNCLYLIGILTNTQILCDDSVVIINLYSLRNIELSNLLVTLIEETTRISDDLNAQYIMLTNQ